MPDKNNMSVLVLAAIALFYWLSPMDLIPDGLPIGLVDDILVAITAGAGIVKSQI